MAKKNKQKKVAWKSEPELHDYPAAAQYLALVVSRGRANDLANELEHLAVGTSFKAKDILRASGLPILDDTNRHVAGDLAKINAGEALSPILLVRGRNIAPGVPLVIADGYHRASTAYFLDENTDIPCRIV